jgi:hypothetical protein
MNWKDYLVIFSFALITIIAFVLFQSAPGYMDAEYYYAMGLRIAKNHTFSEPFAWNYLNGYQGLPQPGFTFWMPAPAFLAGLSMIVARGFDYAHARVGFVFIAVIIPILTAAVGYKISGQKGIGLTAGLFGVFSAFYAPFLTTIDSFGLMMFMGAVYVLTALQKISKKKFFLMGLLAGLMHLTRTDGLLWLVPAVLIAVEDRDKVLSSIVTLAAGYLAVMLPWFIRNWIVLGSTLPSGNTRMFWMTSYNDLFLYHAELLTFSSWIDQGIMPILNSVLKAFVSNLQTALVIQGQIILLPLIVLGFIQYRKDKVIRSVLVTWFLVLVVMTVVFPFAGSRGGFFHSGAAFQPIFWIMAAVGLDCFIKWGMHTRNWKEVQARSILTFGLVVILLSVTIFVHINRVQGSSAKDVQWNRSYLAAVGVDSRLDQLNVKDNELIMINNPPGLFIASGRPSITIPSGGIQEILEAAGDARAEILILEKNHPASLDNLYKNPGAQNGLVFIEAEGGVQYYRIVHDGNQ